MKLLRKKPVRLTPELEKEAWQMFLRGASKMKIRRHLGLSLDVLRRLIERGDPLNNKRPWRDRRADIYRKFEEAEDEAVTAQILKRSRTIGVIEKKGLRTLKQKADSEGLTPAETTMVMRESTQAMRLALDATRTPPGTKITVNANAHAGAAAMGLGAGTGMLDGADDRTGARITVATVKALQASSPEELKAISAWQKKYTLALEEQGLALPPAAREDELVTVIDAPAEPQRVASRRK